MRQSRKEISARWILDSLADGIYITDCERRIIMWNHSAERITGWAPGEILGKTCYDNILCHEDQEGRQLCGKDSCPLHRAIVSGETSTLPVIVFAKHRDGRRIPVEVSVAPLREADGRIVGGVESFRDLGPLMVDLERAHIIQGHAMEVALPPDPRLDLVVHGSPVAYVSGDFHRVEGLDGARYVFMLADVTGHGVASALYAMQLRSLWEESRALLGDPAGFATQLNRHLYTLVREDDCFATAIIGVIDAVTGSLQYVLAGHPAPLRVHEGRVQRLDSRGAALGLLPDTVYRAQTERLAPGDLLLSYTDGAIEVTNPAGEELGEAGLAELFLAQTGRKPALKDTLADLEDALRAYSGHLHFEDDVTLLGIRRPAD